MNNGVCASDAFATQEAVERRMGQARTITAISLGGGCTGSVDGVVGHVGCPSAGLMLSSFETRSFLGVGAKESIPGCKSNRDSDF